MSLLGKASKGTCFSNCNLTVCRLADRSVDILKHLSLRGTNWPEACIVAIQNLAGRLNSRSTRSSTAEPGQHIQTTSFIGPSKLRSSVSTGNPGVHAPCPLRTEQRHPQREKRHPLDQTEVTHQNGDTSSRATSMLPPLSMANPTPFSRPAHSLNVSTDLDGFVFPASTVQLSETTVNQTLASAHLAGTGDFLGIAQQLSDNPIPNSEIMHLFNGDDFDFGMNVEFGLHSTL